MSAILRATLARFILVNRVMIMMVMIAVVIADRRDHDAADLGRRRTRLYGQDIESRPRSRRAAISSQVECPICCTVRFISHLVSSLLDFRIIAHSVRTCILVLCTVVQNDLRCVFPVFRDCSSRCIRVRPSASERRRALDRPRRSYPAKAISCSHTRTPTAAKTAKEGPQ